MTLYLAALLAAGLAVLGFGWIGKTYLRFRGQSLVKCPQTGRSAAVELALGLTGLAAVMRHSRLRLRSCSEWHGGRECGQACLAQIEAAPEACLVRNLLAKWYEGKSCACCGRRFGEITWTQHKPCLMSPEPRLYQWRDIQAETVPRILETYSPVCWTCNVAETHTW